MATAHCNDETSSTPNTLNGFSYGCPRFEGDLAGGVKEVFDSSNEKSPFSANVRDAVFDDSKPYDANKVSKNSYTTIAISNRIDLFSPGIPRRGGKVRYPDCGEVRVIFARNSGVSVGQSDGTMLLGNQFERNIVAFEARIPNPNPILETPGGFPVGCRPLVEFFHRLSDVKLKNEIRAKLLTRLIYEGNIQAVVDGQLVNVARLTRPVADFRNFGEKAGQIRTDQFLNKHWNSTTTLPAPPPTGYDPPGPPTTITRDLVTPQDWTLREFRLDQKTVGLSHLPTQRS